MEVVLAVLAPCAQTAAAALTRRASAPGNVASAALSTFAAL